MADNEARRAGYNLAQGNALGTGRNPAKAPTGRNDRGRESRGYCALTGLLRAREGFPGRCPGLHHIRPFGANGTADDTILRYTGKLDTCWGSPNAVTRNPFGSGVRALPVSTYVSRE